MCTILFTFKRFVCGIPIQCYDILWSLFFFPWEERKDVLCDSFIVSHFPLSISNSAAFPIYCCFPFVFCSKQPLAVYSFCKGCEYCPSFIELSFLSLVLKLGYLLHYLILFTHGSEGTIRVLITLFLVLYIFWGGEGGGGTVLINCKKLPFFSILKFLITFDTIFSLL